MPRELEGQKGEVEKNDQLDKNESLWESQITEDLVVSDKVICWMTVMEVYGRARYQKT